MKIFCILLFAIIIVIILLTCILGKLKKYIHICFSIKLPLASTDINIEADDNK